MNEPRRKTRSVEWVVVANEADAVIYTRANPRGPLEKILEFHNETAHLKASELVSDREGRSFDSHGQGRHAMSREKSGPKRHASGAFAREIARRLVRALQSGECAGFALIAAPRFLGMLRRELDAPGLPEPFLAVDKDVVARDAETIRSLLA